jgi:hypothetical protein
MSSGWLCFAAAAALSAAEIPSGTHIEIRLTTAVNSVTARVNDPVEAVVIAPVVSDGNIALAAGTKVKAEIQDVKQPAKADDQAMVQIQFDQLVGAGGQRVPLKARLAGIDNARETVDDQGRIQGIVASQTGTARLDQGIAKVTEKYPGLGDFLGMAKGAVIKQVDPSIHYEPGVEMTVELTQPLHWRETAPPPAVRAIAPADRLAELVNREPARTVALKPPSPSDTTNIMYIGSREQIEAAFKAAGWNPAANLGKVSEFETFRAMAEDRGYKEGPVSVLMLDGRPPDLVFEKVNDTFNARHHLRIWYRPETFNGEDVWVCAATHDIGIAFSDRDYTFIHKVDPEIDKERAKVVSDLLFTGKVRGLALVERPNAPATGQNATGDDFKTDGRMAVLEF